MLNIEPYSLGEKYLSSRLVDGDRRPPKVSVLDDLEVRLNQLSQTIQLLNVTQCIHKVEIEVVTVITLHRV